jgi:hypothetical protein
MLNINRIASEHSLESETDLVLSDQDSDDYANEMVQGRRIHNTTICGAGSLYRRRAGEMSPRRSYFQPT